MSPTQIKFNPVVKDRLFYDRYEYCFSFQLAEATVLRGLKHDLIDSRLDQRIEWREMARQRWKNSIDVLGWNLINNQVRADLHTVCSAIVDSGVDCKIAVSHHVGYLYTNDPGLINHLVQFKCLTNKKYTRVKINRPRDTILLKKSRYQRRSYCGYIKVTQQQKENLLNFFENHRENIRVSPAFQEWLKEKPFLRLLDHYFIDYNEDHWLTMLALIAPGLIRKTQTIITK